MPNSNIACADFLDFDLGNAKFDVAILDAPYLLGKDFGKNAGFASDDMPEADFLAWMRDVIAKCRDRLHDDGLCYVYNFPELAARISSMYPLDSQRLLQWHYTNKNTHSVKFWQRSHETIICLWHPDRARYPDVDVDAIRVPYSKAHQAAADKGLKRPASVGRFNSKRRETVFLDHGGAAPRDVMTVPALAGGAGTIERWMRCDSCGGVVVAPHEKSKHRNCADTWSHPTQKPAKLTEYLMKSALVPEGRQRRVLVPFAGSGSECAVAEQLGFDWVATEINPEFAAFGNEMLRQVRAGLADAGTDDNANHINHDAGHAGSLLVEDDND